jgi:hypothetical protein
LPSRWICNTEGTPGELAFNADRNRSNVVMGWVFKVRITSYAELWNQIFLRVSKRDELIHILSFLNRPHIENLTRCSAEDGDLNFVRRIPQKKKIVDARQIVGRLPIDGNQDIANHNARRFHRPSGKYIRNDYPIFLFQAESHGDGWRNGLDPNANLLSAQVSELL